MEHFIKKTCFRLASKVGLFAGSRSSARPSVMVSQRATMAAGPSKCPTPVPKMVHSATQVGIVPDNKRYKRLMTLQSHFCRPDGVIVWQKMGQRDKMFYQLTLLNVLFGFLDMVYVLNKWVRK